MNKSLYIIPIIFAVAFFYLGLNSNNHMEEKENVIKNIETQTVSIVQNKNIKNLEQSNYTIEHCKYDLRNLIDKEHHFNRIYDIKQQKYKDDNEINCLIVYYMEIREQDFKTKWLIHIAKNYPYLKPYERELKLAELIAPELEKIRQEKIESEKIKIPEYVEDYDYVDYESKTISIFEEEIYEDEETRIKNIHKEHKHGIYDPKYAEYPYSKKTNFDVKKFKDTILYFVGDNINQIDKFQNIDIKNSDFPIKSLNFEYENEFYKIELSTIYYNNVFFTIYFSQPYDGVLYLNIKNNTLKGVINFKNKEINLNFKDSIGYVYTYKTNDKKVPLTY